MNWLKILLTKCQSFKIEATPIEDAKVKEIARKGINLKGKGESIKDGLIGLHKHTILFVCPEIPEKKVMEQIAELVPSNFKCKFFESLKGSTVSQLALMLRSTGGFASCSVGDHDVHIKIEGTQVRELDDPYWIEIQDLIKQDGYAQTLEILINDKKIVYNAKIEQIIKENQTRTTEISRDDLTNLQITLGTSKTVEDFLRSLEGKKPRRKK
jgi:hypothetical protein